MAQQTRHHALSMAIQAGAQLGLTVALARWFSPDGMGAYGLLGWLIAMAGVLVHLGGITTTVKYVSEAQGAAAPELAAGYLTRGLRTWGRNLFWVSLLWLALGPSMVSTYGQHGLDSALSAALPLIATSSLFTWLLGACQALQRYGQCALASALWAASLVLATGLAMAWDGGLVGVLLAQTIAWGMGCAVLWRGLTRWRAGWWHQPLPGARQRELRKFAAPLALMVLLDALIWQRSGVLFLGQSGAPSEVAYYTLAFGLAQLAMRTIPGSLIGVLVPAMSRAVGAGDTARVGSLYRVAGRWMGATAVWLATLGTVLGPPLLPWIYGEAYGGMVAPFSILLWAGAIAMALGFPASSVLYALEQQRAVLRMGLATALLYLLLAIQIIPAHGAQGAAWVTAIAQSLSVAAGVGLAARACGGIRPDWSSLARITRAATVTFVPLWALASHLPPALALAIGAPLGTVIYALACWKGGVVTSQEQDTLRRWIRHQWTRRHRTPEVTAITSPVASIR
ncbi:MAG: polysaccharide biosynthesis C-terminal domain-containing protein [Candidatus Sericytochromatia bacterium]|nr:polysaccharide biosynthesis C-terminal domain-containing protein [Candidatus Sericytochromatia bacterium]